MMTSSAIHTVKRLSESNGLSQLNFVFEEGPLVDDLSYDMEDRKKRAID